MMHHLMKYEVTPKKNTQHKFPSQSMEAQKGTKERNRARECDG
jgi:hypothetical protein